MTRYARLVYVAYARAVGVAAAAMLEFLLRRYGPTAAIFDEWEQR